MRIAFVVEEFPKISETFVLNQAIGLMKLGHDVGIFSFSRGDTKVVNSDVGKYGLLKKVMYLDPLYRFSDRVRQTRLTLDEKLFKKTNLRLPSSGLFRTISELTMILNLVRLFRFSNKGNYDIIHCQTGLVGLRFLSLRRLGIFRGKLIVHFRGNDLTEFIKQKGERVYSKLFRQADYFLPVCDYLRKRAIEIGCPRDKIFVMRSAIDLRRFKFYERKKPAKGPTRIVFVGRLVEKKGVEYAIGAISILKKKGRSVDLLIIGDGPLENNLKNLSRKLGLEKCIIFLGVRNNNYTVRVLNQAHLLVAPSVTSESGDEEGIPNVLKEAMAVGLPVVSTYHAGIPELVEDGVSGFLVPERDTQALADKLAFLIEHPNLWSKMGRAGRKFVEENYDKERLNKELVDIYQRLIG